MSVWPVLLALFFVGCEKTPAVDVRPTDLSRAADGVVHLPSASLKFIRVEEVGAATAAGGLRAPAKVAFRENALSRVGARLAGRVVQVHVKTGDIVRAGAPLVTLDCPEAAAARASLLAAEASAREARAALERERRMIAEGVGVERDRLAAEKHLAEAEAELSRTRATRAFVGAGEGSIVVLRAPIAGTVISRTTTVGAAVQPSSEPLVEIGDPQKLWVVADVFERDLALVREGQRVRVELSTVPAPLEGQVAAVGAAVTGGVRTAQVRIIVEKLPGTLRAGMLGRVTIETGSAGMTLPARAVLIREGAMIVYIARKDGGFERRPVQVGSSVEGRVRVQSGLQSGDHVVVEGALLLDGAAEQLL